MSAIAFDVETWLIQPSIVAPPLVCGSASGGQGGKIYDKEDTREIFRRLLDSEALIIGHNIPYDMIVMAQDAAARGVDLVVDIFNHYRKGKVYDTKIAEMLDAIARGSLYRDAEGNSFKRYSLDQVVQMRLGRTNAKENDVWRLRYSELDELSLEEWPEEAIQYPKDDAQNTFEVFQAQANCQNLHDLPAQVYTDFTLQLGAAHGFRVDPVELEKLETRVHELRSQNFERFKALGVYNLDKQGNIRRTKSGAESVNKTQLKRWLLEALDSTDPCPKCDKTGKTISEKSGKPVNCKRCDGTGYEPNELVGRTPAGGITADRDALQECGDELLSDYSEHSETDKIVGTYLPWLRTGTRGPITLNPNVLVATGRTSYKDPAQVMPRKWNVRNCMIPRKGFYFCSSDYSGLEMVTHAQSCLYIFDQDPNVTVKLAEVLNSGIDAHSYLGAQMMGISYEEFMRRKALGDPIVLKFRQAAKAGNFGFPGGMGAEKFALTKRNEDAETIAPDGTIYKGLRLCLLIGGAEQCGVKMEGMPRVCVECVKCAKTIRNSWMKAFPENKAYFAKISGLDGVFIQHVSERVRGGLGFCDAANTPFQGLGADATKLAFRESSYEEYCVRDSPLYGSRNILMAHDEILAEVPISTAHEAAKRLEEIMVASLIKFCPDMKPAIKAEPALMTCWEKGAEPNFDDKGRLIPWAA